MTTNDTAHFLTEQAVAELLNGPKSPDRLFTGACTYGDIHAMACTILTNCSGRDGQKGSLGIFTSDRAVIAATMIAALAGGPILILPHDISDRAIEDLAANDPEHTWGVADPGRILPPCIQHLSLEPADRSREPVPLKPCIDMDAPLLRLYTGGSTGKPVIWTKTVENILGEALFHVGVHGITCEDVVVATVPPYHIYGLLFSVAAPLLAGAYVADQSCSFPHEIINTVANTKATLLVSVPAHFRALKDHDFPAHHLRFAFSSAGVLDEDDETAFRTRNSVPVMEVYGSTETGGIAFRCRGRDELFFTPFDAIEVDITGEQLKIRSPFISPEIARDEYGTYLVPDRVKKCSDGCFEILGRSDTVVKIAGRRVDLDQVGAVLKTMDGVRDAMVLARAIPRGRSFDICALVEGSCSNARIREFVSGKLETAAHPRWIKTVDHMPVTRSGKYDRAAIAAMFDSEGGQEE